MGEATALADLSQDSQDLAIVRDALIEMNSTIEQEFGGIGTPGYGEGPVESLAALGRIEARSSRCRAGLRLAIGLLEENGLADQVMDNRLYEALLNG